LEIKSLKSKHDTQVEENQLWTNFWNDNIIEDSKVNY